MDPRPQRRVRRRAETLRARRTRREPPQSRRSGRHEPVPDLHPLELRPRHPRQYGLVKLLHRHRMSQSLGPVRDMCFRSLLRTGRNGIYTGHGSQGAMTLDKTSPQKFPSFIIITQALCDANPIQRASRDLRFSERLHHLTAEYVPYLAKDISTRR